MNPRERRAGKHGRRPRAKILGCEILAADLFQVCVDTGGRHITAVSRVVQVLEELLARQVAACTNDAGEPAVVETDFVTLAALASKLKADRRPCDIYVAVAQRGQTKGAICARVFIVADADEGALEQLHDARQDPGAAEAGLCEIGRGPGANRRQRGGEALQPVELGFIARLSPSRVIAVLLASARVTSRCLQVAAGIRADPDIGPGRTGSPARGYA